MLRHNVIFFKVSFLPIRVKIRRSVEDFDEVEVKVEVNEGDVVKQLKILVSLNDLNTQFVALSFDKTRKTCALFVVWLARQVLHIISSFRNERKLTFCVLKFSRLTP